MPDDLNTAHAPQHESDEPNSKRQFVGKVATPRTVVSRGTLKSQRPAITRPGALDYRDIPSVAGDERLAYVGPTSTRSRRDGNT